MKKICVGGLYFLVTLLLVGCVGSGDCLLDEREGLNDPYFTGQFSYEFAQKRREIHIYLRDKRYLIEEGGKLVGFATLHPFRDDFLIVQSWNVKRGGADPPYAYYLLRKTLSGFEVGKELCENWPCNVSTRAELTERLDLQAKLFLTQPHNRLDVRHF